MKRLVMTFLVFTLFGTATGFAQPIPTEQLEQYFINNGIEYLKTSNYFGSGGDDDFLFVPTRDPQDNETMGVFFDLHTGNGLDDVGMHWGVGLRGPRVGNPYGGRGLALGHLSSFHACLNVGGFLEDFTANEMGNQLQLTQCVNEPLQNHKIYRIDLHVSKHNTSVRIWEKTVTSFNTYYTQIADYSCVDDPGPGRTGFCPELPEDENFGGLVLGAAFLDAGFTWSARQIHIAFF